MSISNRIAVTGANGFLGQAIVARLVQDGHQVTSLTRRPLDSPGTVAHLVVDLLNRIPDPEILTGQDLIIHLAGNVAGNSISVDPAESENAVIAHNLSNAAQIAEVPNLLVLSSIMAKAAEDGLLTVRDYGYEKAAADKIILHELAPEQRVVFLRPPAIYGPGMRGSLATLAKLIRKGVPLPLGLARTPRPYLSLQNLTDLVSATARLDQDAWTVCDRKFLEIYDGELVTTAELVRAIGQVIGKPVRLLPVPAALLYLVAKPLGKTDLIESAFADPLMTPTDNLTSHFGWAPSETMPESLAFLKTG